MEFGYYTPEDARMVLNEVRRLRALRMRSEVRDPHAPEQTPLYVKNASGLEIPPYGCMQITDCEDINGQNYIVVDQHDDSVFGDFLFNGPIAIDASGDKNFGVAQRGPVFRAQAAASQTVTSGDLWGVSDGTFTIEEGGTRFVVLGEDDIDTDIVRVKYSGIQSMIYGAVTPAAGIGAMSGTSPDSATCDLYLIDYAGQWVDTGMNATVYNIMDADIAGDERIWVAPSNDKFVVISENCPGGAGSSNPT